MLLTLVNHVIPKCPLSIGRDKAMVHDFSLSLSLLVQKHFTRVYKKIDSVFFEMENMTLNFITLLDDFFYVWMNLFLPFKWIFLN